MLFEICRFSLAMTHCSPRLWSVFSGRWPLTPEEDGTFSISRDPTGFSMVLQFLRAYAIDPSTVSPGEMAAFVEDVDYYGLPVESVEKWLGRGLRTAGEHFSSEDHTEGIVVANDQMVAKHTSQVGKYQWVLGANLYGGQDHVVITMRIERAGAYTLFGILGERPALDNGESWCLPTSYGFDRHGSWVCNHNVRGECFW